ncbi:cell division FtsK/SpoIIIE [Neobacillus vireti LMG 21834]|uniref:Cell division FtsK/SpoIIIE n=3 Tax=Neobacillus TaxID=2675232 RepID=A0AB94ITR0_9BACI|nr:DNA translocase FtsK [Neobacillus vireti]ETI70435.1 cell division FtsK/SpoIIIE [Neobacillus vireti LMG 21834]
MSWIQDLFQKFKRDDEEKYEDNSLHNHKPENPPFLNQYESLKDLDAKVSYQYPKGSVRPSVVPQEKQKAMETTVRQNRSKKLNQERRKIEQQEAPPVKKEVPKTKYEPISRSRGPFQPTEIPSPVFGFNRPKKTDSVVEHELSHFLEEDFDNQLDELVLQKESAPIVSVQKEPALITPIQEEQSLIVSVKEKPMPMTTPVQEVSNELIVADEVEVINTATKAIEIIQNQKIIPLAEELADAHNEAMEEASPGLELELESESNLEEPDPPAPKRSHLPFNVMMLKQDKQKWEERKRRSEREEQRVISTEIKPVENVQQINQHTPDIVEEIQHKMDDGLYELPKSSLLNPPVTEVMDTKWLLEQEELLNLTLQNFNVGASVVHVTQGPSVTRFEVQPEPGVKVNKITNLSDDIKLSLAARDIRIEAPIPGKHTIGIEVPNQKSRPVLINEIIQTSVFAESVSPLTAVLGLDIAGKPIVTDLKKMPHGLIAGATGSGKSVCINSILVSLIFKAKPEDLKLLLIDPKMVELAPYNRIPHLVSPVITDVKAATAALKWAVDEMERRYELFAHTGVRDINRFNELAMQHKRYSDKLPFIVIVIDELADLMMMSPADVEEAICRIAQKARACGIHLIVATQRPSVDVITGLIKANIPTRIAFSVSSQVDSRTIIDIGGAEKLLGRGDMLFLENGSSKPVRLQGTYVSDEEIDLVVAHVREQREPEYLFEQEELLKKAQVTEEEDELFYEACEFIIEQGGASTSSLQRRFKIGYNRAARLMDMLETNGYITGANGSKPRDVLITEADLEAIQD